MKKRRPIFFRTAKLSTAEERAIQRYAPVGVLLWLLTLASCFIGIWWLTVIFGAIFCGYAAWSARRRSQLLTEMKRQGK
jgi:hypothetical protein